MTEKSDEQKKPRLELKKTFDAGKIKQSFSHGRSRSVSVEVKKKRFFSDKKFISSEESLEKNLESENNNTKNDSNVEETPNKIPEEKITQKEAAGPELKTKTSTTERIETKEGKKKFHKSIPNKDVDQPEEQNKKLSSFKLIKVPKKMEDRRKGKLTISEALNDNSEKVRSLAAVKRAREKAKLRLNSVSESKDLQKEKKKRDIIIPDFIAVNELGSRLAEKNSDVIKVLMKLGVMATINQTIDGDTAELVVIEFGHTPKRVSESDVEIGLDGEKDLDEEMVSRGPVVTIMGHVDHGKTSLLDAIREKKVSQSEAGGITQHIGAYMVDSEKGKITFLDTPGHAAFSQMRARGSNITDLVVLVVAADDSVNDQTVEAINHAKAAKCPIIVAINKIDLPNANIAKVENDLMNHGIVSEKMGGENLVVEVSAKSKKGIENLIDSIHLQSELLELKANPNRDASGVVIESKVETGRGPVISVLIQKGTLKVGDIVIAGKEWGKVKALSNDEGKRVISAVPSYPIEILGLSGAPSAGDEFVVVENESRAREVTQYRDRLIRLKENSSVKRGTVEQMISSASEAVQKNLPILIKADVHGSKEALEQSLSKLKNEEIKIRILHSGVGEINESDVSLASASNALIFGFNVKTNVQARNLSKREGVVIKYYSIIYEVIDEVKRMLDSELEPDLNEKIIGNVEIRKVFNISKTTSIAGCFVQEGKVTNNCKVRLIREDEEIYKSEIDSLRREKDEVKEVSSGTECGIRIRNFNDFKEGDILECYLVSENTK